jgi:protein AFG1
MLGPLREYQNLIKLSKIKANAAQLNSIMVLQQLHETLTNYKNTPIKPKKGLKNKDLKVSPDFKFMETVKNDTESIFKKFMNKVTPTKPIESPQGLYLHGGVGTGKSMLMDLLYNQIDAKKKRIHFHQFIQDIHNRIHTHKQQYGYQIDAIPWIAYEIAQENYLLCLDEFQVTDIADAMILKSLLNELFKQGVVLVTTSNRKPRDLYENGIQRKSFLESIDLLEQKCLVLNLDSGEDFRKLDTEFIPVFCRISESSDRKLNDVFEKLGLINDQNAVRTFMELDCWGRSFKIESKANVAFCSFDELCKQNKSAADYLLITQKFQTIVLKNIPGLNRYSRNEARRFITFIDTCYENKVVLVASFEKSISHIFDAGELDPQEVLHSDRLLFDDLKLGVEGLKSSMFNGDEEVFAFHRAISRLIEMQGVKWIGESNAKIIREIMTSE